MMNGISLVCQCRLLFYIGVNSNGGKENDGREGKRREREREGREGSDTAEESWTPSQHVFDVKVQPL